MAKNTKITNMSIRTDYDWLDKTDEAAARHGLDRTKFVKKSVNVYTSFDMDFLRRIQKLSQSMKLPEWIVIQNMAIVALAEKEAEIKAHGEPKNPYPFVFVEDTEGWPEVLTGEQLYSYLLRTYSARELGKGAD